MKHTYTALNRLFLFVVLFLTSITMNSQTVAFNPIPTINCPSGNMIICGTYTQPNTGGPYNVTTSTTLIGNATIVTGITDFATTITATSFCLTIPINELNGSPFGNYEISVLLTFTQINAPFAVITSNTTPNGSNPTGTDIFYSNTCPIIANDDSITVSQCVGGNINIISNDVILGNPATTSNVVITQLTTSPNIAFNAITGIASIPAGTTPGTYNFSYQICNPINASQCDPAIVSFIVAPQPVVAIIDTFSVSGCTGGTTTSVLTNDTLCGIPFSNPVYVSFVGTVPVAGATINNAGIISIPAGTAPGSYTFTYKVCHVNAPTSCSNTATVTINVSNPPLIANNDNFSSPIINTLSGGYTLSVLTNDTLNGVPATSSNVTTSIVSSSPPIVDLAINSSGIITVPGGVTVGTYTIIYSITKISCTSNVANGFVTITVGANEETPDIVPGVRANSIVSLVDTQSNNKIIIVGYFTKYNSIDCISIARLKSDLTIDNLTGFNTIGPLPLAVGPFGGGKQVPLDMKVLKNTANLDKILLVGNFTGFSGSLSNGTGIARLDPDGNIDPTFNNETLAPGIIRGVSGSNSQIRTFYVYPDNALNGNAGKIIIGGMFESYNGQPAYKLARLFPNGMLDQDFSTNINQIVLPGLSATNGFNSAPQAIEVQNDGGIIVGGYFSQFNGHVRKNILRLYNDGKIDPSFNNSYSGSNPNVLGTHIQKILIQPDNKIIIAGFFSKYNNVSRNSIARLDSNGSLDTSFNPGSGFFPIHVPSVSYGGEPAGMIRSLALEPVAGNIPFKLYVSGNFTKFNNTVCDEVIRLHCNATSPINGTKDGTFGLAGGGPNGYVWSMKKQGSKLIIGGQFTTYNVTSSALNITRILPAPLSGELRSSTIYYDSEPEIDLFADDEVIIYPNPSNGTINFSTNVFGSQKFSVEIHNVLGQKVFEKVNLKLDDISLDLSNLVKGTYFITFGDDNKKVSKTVILN